MVYATRNSQDGAIHEGAKILSFDTRAQAEMYLMAGTVEGIRPRVQPGRFDTCWRQSQTPLTPSESERLCAPFAPDEINESRPTAGNAYHYTPTADVLVLVEDET